MFMNDTDLFFTQTIVGAPFSVTMGRRVHAPKRHAAGVRIDLDTGESQFGAAWNDWLQIHRPRLVLGRPVPAPGRVQLWLERQALLVLVIGLLLCAAGVTMLAWRH